MELTKQYHIAVNAYSLSSFQNTHVHTHRHTHAVTHTVTHMQSHTQTQSHTPTESSETGSTWRRSTTVRPPMGASMPTSPKDVSLRWKYRLHHSCAFVEWIYWRVCVHKMLCYFHNPILWESTVACSHLSVGRPRTQQCPGEHRQSQWDPDLCDDRVGPRLWRGQHGVPAGLSPSLQRGWSSTHGDQ